MFILFYLKYTNTMIQTVYPNHHVTNPYYSNPLRGKPADMNAAISCGEFINAMADSYRALNARYWLPEMIGIGSVADRIAAEEAEYEKQLVRLSPPVIPSRGPKLRTFRDIRDECVDKLDLRGLRIDGDALTSRPVEITPKGKTQFLIPGICFHPAP